MLKVAVIGSISMDFVVTTDKLPQKGETVMGKNFSIFFGGKGANQAIATSRSGLNTFMVGAVGSDSFGEYLVKNLNHNNIDTSMIKIIDNTESGSAIIQVKDGDNRIIVVEGANSKLSIDDIHINENILEDMDMIILQNEIPIKVVEFVIEFCKDKNIKVLYNPAPYKQISKEIIDKVDFLTPNEKEFEEIYGERKISSVLRELPNKLIVTLGSRGTIFHNGIEEIMIPAYKVENDKVIDTTGAGDTFNGYFASGILNNMSIEKAIQYGNLASSIAIQYEGAQDGIPYHKDLFFT